jgi:DNA mismatch repair protein MutS2
LHGKGNGVLRDLIRQYLHGVNEVRSMADEELERGGNGITVVRFR